MSDTPDTPVTETQSGAVDFFGFGDAVQHDMSRDPSQHVLIAVMNEGKRLKYQNSTARPVEVDRESQSISLTMMPAQDAHALIKTAVTGWNFTSQGQPVPFTTQNLNRWLESGNPADVDEVVEAIRDANPWMLAEATTVEAIEQEIEDLTIRRNKLLAIEAGNAD